MGQFCRNNLAEHLGLSIALFKKNQQLLQSTKTFMSQFLLSVMEPNNKDDLTLCTIVPLKFYVEMTEIFRGTQK